MDSVTPASPVCPLALDAEHRRRYEQIRILRRFLDPGERYPVFLDPTTGDVRKGAFVGQTTPAGGKKKRPT